MKTSNKILLGLLVIIFTVPILLANTLRAKVKKGEYTVEKFDNARNERLVAGSFNSYKVVKIISPKPDLLTCRVRVSEKMDFSYYKQENKDSVNVLNLNDTLVIKYIPFKPLTNNIDEDRDWERAYEVSINLPSVNNLVIDGAVVILDSVSPSNNNISVILENRGELKKGGPAENGRGERSVGVNSAKNNKALEDAEMAKTEGPKVLDDVDFKLTDNSGTGMVDLDIKELLVYSLFYKI